MKLRSKLKYIGEEKPKGRVGTLIGYSKLHDRVEVEFKGEDGGIITYFYRSLAELNKDWEDYTPQEPRIEDEKVRKALRAWAEANGIEDVGVVQHRDITTICDTHTDITFYGNLPGLIDGADYTITELCGEEVWE